MILIDETYFTGELSLPMLPVNTASMDDEGGNEWKNAIQTVKENDLSAFVDKYVSKYLIKLFGLQFTNTFLEELDKEGPGEIWINLKNQLLIKIGDYKASPLSNYTYYWIMRDARTSTTIAGEAAPGFDNANSANIGSKLEKAWNDMVDMTENVINYVFDEHFEDYKPYLSLRQCADNRFWELVRPINKFNL